MRQFIEDLFFSPSYYARHQSARKIAFAFSALLVGLFTGVGMYYYGYSLASIALGAVGSIFTTAFSSIILFTNERSNFLKWLDDTIYPPKSVTITLPETDIEKGSALNQERLGLVNTVLQQSKENANIAKLKENLKKIFAMRSYSAMSDKSFNEMENQFNKKVTDFLKSIKTEADWDLPENIKQLKLLIVEAALYSDALLALMEQEMRKEKVDVTTENVAKWLKNQRKRYCRSFLCSGVVDLYHVAKGKLAVKDGSITLATTDDKDYYHAQSDKNSLRKIYNTFIKEGFYQRYGNKAFRYALLKEDQRFEHWTQRDSKRKRTFRPFPDTRPT